VRLALRRSAARLLVQALAVGMLGACAPRPEILEVLPALLADTGLYADPARHVIADDVLAFEPQYPLWTDGATKKRWIRLPPGGSIDARDPDHFVFPVGTRLWKEFSLERRIETRMATLGTDGWHFAAYRWSADERVATLAPECGVAAACESAPGVPYDVPGRADCLACHAAGPAAVLGFTALQLSSDRDPLAPHAQPLPEGAVDLDDLVRLGLVRNLPQRLVDAPPRIQAASPLERAALGYLSANCGMCHSSSSSLAGLGLDLSYSLARPSEKPAIATTLARPSRYRWAGETEPLRVAPAAVDLGVLPRRMSSRHALSRMPPLGTRLPDEEALELVTTWIRTDLASPGAVSTNAFDHCNNTHSRGIPQ